MSRRDEKTPKTIMKNVDGVSSIVKELSDKLVSEYCQDLDDLMVDLRQEIISKEIDNYVLESYIMELANTLYFTGSAQEDLGIKEDTCRAIRQQLYNALRDDADGTVADKNAQAELGTQEETIALAIYSRSYKKVKLRMDAGYEMLASLKKIMNKRISEMELSNSRYIGGSRNETTD